VIVFAVSFFLKKKHAATILSFPVFFLLGVIFIYPCIHPVFNDSDIVHHTGNQRVNVEGIVDSSPVMTRKGIRVYLKDISLHTKNNSRSLSGRLMVSIKEPERVYCYGDRIRFFCYLRKPSNFNNPGSFDYVRYLSFKNIFVTAFLGDDSGVTKTGEGYGNFILLNTDRYRARIRTLIDDVIPTPAGAVLKALILGDRGVIPEEIREQFVKLGDCTSSCYVRSSCGNRCLCFLICFLICFSRVYPKVLYMLMHLSGLCFCLFFPYCFTV